MLYRISTEWQPNIYKLVSESGFDSFTVFNAIGYWKGTKEISAIVEIELNSGNPFAEALRIEKLAKRIAKVNKQEAVLVTSLPSHSKLVTQ